MDISQVVEIAVANVDPERVAIAGLEPADVAKESVGGLAQVLSELVDNALAFSEPDDQVTITGAFDRGDYVMSISDRGAGIPETLLAALNDVLSNPARVGNTQETPLGIVMVARLAARLGIDVKLIPSVPGTTARLTVPEVLVSTGRVFQGPSDDEDPDPSPPASPLPAAEAPPHRSGHVVAMSEQARREAEAFLEKVFGPLVGQQASRRPANARSNGNSHVGSGPEPTQPNPTQPNPTQPNPILQTRVPGASFTVADDDPSVASGEGAVDIRLNLSRYDEGRRQASESGPDDETRDDETRDDL